MVGRGWGAPGATGARGLTVVTMSETPQWPQSARLRAGDADRQRTIERLTQSWRDGRLTRDEFQRRTQQSFEATFRDELDALTADLTGLAPISPELPHDAPAVPLGAESVLAGRQPEYREVAARYAPAGASGSAVSVGFLSGMDKIGDWTVAPVHASLAFWGGTTIDLRDAIFTSADTTITCIAVMGGIEVIVPPEMEVRVSGLGLMGGFGWDKKREARQTAPAPAGNPRVTINGLAFWGGVGVVRKEREEPLG